MLHNRDRIKRHCPARCRERFRREPESQSRLLVPATRTFGRTVGVHCCSWPEWDKPETIHHANRSMSDCCAYFLFRASSRCRKTVRHVDSFAESKVFVGLSVRMLVVHPPCSRRTPNANTHLGKRLGFRGKSYS